MRLPALLLSGCACWMPAALLAGMPTWLAAAEAIAPAEPIAFLDDGRIQRLLIGGNDVAQEDAARNGVAILWFDGQVVRTQALNHVTRDKDGWVLCGDRKLPRCTLQVQQDGARTRLRLVRIEGFPAGRDTSLDLHLGLQAPVRATCAGAGVLLGKGKSALDVTWTFPGQAGALATYADVSLEAAP